MSAHESAAPLAWRKAQRSVGNGACVEVAPVKAGFAVRDSKRPHGHILTCSAETWQGFLTGIKNGRFSAP